MGSLVAALQIKKGLTEPGLHIKRISIHNLSFYLGWEDEKGALGEENTEDPILW